VRETSLISKGRKRTSHPEKKNTPNPLTPFKLRKIIGENVSCQQGTIKKVPGNHSQHLYRCQGGMASPNQLRQGPTQIFWKNKPTEARPRKTSLDQHCKLYIFLQRKGWGKERHTEKYLGVGETRLLTMPGNMPARSGSPLEKKGGRNFKAHGVRNVG